MPYIDAVHRKKYTALLNILKYLEIESKGELEYLIFSLMKQFMFTRESKYSNLHDCVYATQHCSDEFRRRYLDRREDEALHINGDV
jgi:hypothetical protein